MKIPDHIRYGSPEECRDALSRPMRCFTDPRWRWPDVLEPLPIQRLSEIEAALKRRIWQMRTQRRAS